MAVPLDPTRRSQQQRGYALPAARNADSASSPRSTETSAEPEDIAADDVEPEYETGQVRLAGDVIANVTMADAEVVDDVIVKVVDEAPAVHDTDEVIAPVASPLRGAIPPYRSFAGSVVPVGLAQRAENEEAITALLRRVVDPRGYDGGSAEAETFVEPMNALLAADGFEVGLDRGRPFARRDDASERASLKQVAAALASPELRATVRSLVSDQALADILISRLDEVEAAHNAGAFVLAVVGTGSFIEGLLHDVMRLRDPEIRKTESTRHRPHVLAAGARSHQ